MSLRVVIVEDVEYCRHYLRMVCETQMGFEVVGEAGDYATAVAVTMAQRPDLLLLDLELEYEPGRRLHGFDVAATVRGALPGLRYAFLSSHCNGEVVRRAEAAGGCGFIDKRDFTESRLMVALQALAAGRSYFSTWYLAIREQRRQGSHDCDKLLTEKERKVLALVGHGLDDFEIAAYLGLAARTAGDHQLRIRHKLGVRTREQLMIFAIDRGITLFDPPDLPAANCLA